MVTEFTLSRTIRVAALAGVLALAVSKAALAQVTPARGSTPPDDTQATKVGAVIFYDYTFLKSPVATDSAGNVISPNAFNVARAYINITGNISHVIAFRITPDVTRFALAGNGLDGSAVFRMKYGYAQFNLDQWTGNWKQTWVRMGIQQTPYIDAEEGVYRYRFQGTLFGERDFGLASSDAGLSYHSNLPNGYGDFHAGVYNGEGYSKIQPANSNQQSIQVRGTLRPMPMGGAYSKGLRVSGFLVNDHYVPNGIKRRGLGSVWYEHKHLSAGLDVMTASDLTLPATSPACAVTTPPAACGVQVESRGWSFFATPIFKERGNGPEMLLRVDRYEPNEAAAVKTIRKREIVGIAYWFPHPGGPSTAAILFDFERVRQPGTLTQQRYTLHGLINF